MVIFDQVRGSGQASDWLVEFDTPEGVRVARGETKKGAVLNWGRALLQWRSEPCFQGRVDRWLEFLRQVH